MFRLHYFWDVTEKWSRSLKTSDLSIIGLEVVEFAHEKHTKHLISKCTWVDSVTHLYGLRKVVTLVQLTGAA